MAFDYELATKMAEKAVSAAQSGVKLNWNSPNDVSQFALSILAIGVGQIPILGALMSSTMVMLGQVMFPSPSVDPWEKVRERVETLIGAKIQEHQVKVLKAKMEGFKKNSESFARVWNDYNSAQPDEKKDKARLLQYHHIAFLAVLQSSIPEFQIPEYAAATLPLFAQAANVHMALLGDGIRNGKDWGYADSYIANTLQVDFKMLTGSGNSARDLSVVNRRADKAELDLLKEAIDFAEKNGLSPDLIATWKEAYGILIAQFATKSKRDTLDYVSHVNKYYAEARAQVQPYAWKSHSKHYFGKGHEEALALQAAADFDMEMIENVLNFAEFWPYLAGATMPALAMTNLDREIFRGPYSRGTEQAAWSAKSPAPVTKRGDRITAVRVCADQDIEGLRVQYGATWGPGFGKCRPEFQKEFQLAADEYIANVDLVYGHKVGKMTFTTNKGTVHGPYGKQWNSKEGPLAVNRTGYALTSMYSSQHSGASPRGIEGIIFGFRPLLTAKQG